MPISMGNDMCVRPPSGDLASNSMLKDASRRKFDIVMAWAIDRFRLSNEHATFSPAT
jgi:hypothetical protein